MVRSALVSTLLCGALCFALAGCVHGSSVTVGRSGSQPSYGSGPGRGHGPPPHAPAYGYRKKQGERHEHYQKHGDVELVFDSNRGVYVVVGLPNHFFWDGVYLRVEDGRWFASARLDGDWEPCSNDSLPPGLRKKTAKGRSKKSHGPAKGAW
jgi:hypothetical protein